MSTSERVLIKEFDTTEEAMAAENRLLGSGLTKDIVYRTGRKIRVVAQWESQARAVLEGDEAVTTGTSEESSYGAASYDATDTTDTMDTTSSADAGSTFAAADEDLGSSVVTPVPDITVSVPDTTVSADATTSTTASTVQNAAAAVKDTAQQAASTVSESVQDATEAVTSRVGQVTDAAADKVESLAYSVQEKAYDQDAPAIQRTVAQTTANTLDKTSQYLRQRDLGVVLEDLRSAIRRHPGRSLLIGLGLGYLIRGRFFSGSSPAVQAPPQPDITTYRSETEYDTTDLLPETTVTTTLPDSTTSDVYDASAVDVGTSDIGGTYSDTMDADLTADQSSLSGIDTTDVLVVDDADTTATTDFGAGTTLDDIDGTASDPLNTRNDVS